MNTNVNNASATKAANPLARVHLANDTSSGLVAFAALGKDHTGMNPKSPATRVRGQIQDTPSLPAVTENPPAAEALTAPPVPSGEVFERPSEAHSRDPILRTDHGTGLKYWDMPKRRPLHEIMLKHDTPGLRAFADGSGLSIWLEYISPAPIDEADAIDAQCRAGWPDTGHGFNGFKTAQLLDGSYIATWKCWVSCE